VTHDRRFFSGMAAAGLVTVVAGFAPTYFLSGLFEGPPLSPTLHLHGALFTAWMVLFLVQALLVAAKRTDVHRRLGVAGAVLAVAMLLVGPIVAISAARRGVSVPGGPPPLQFLAIPLGDLVLFASLVGVGISLRRRSQVHKRLMLMATIGLLPPAIARLPYVGAAGPLAFFGLTDLFVAACLVYDRVTLGRVHPAFLWGAIAVVASQPLRLAVSATPCWLRFAEWLTRG
jgi:FtsH-binding integral membrane protein